MLIVLHGVGASIYSGSRRLDLCPGKCCTYQNRYGCNFKVLRPLLELTGTVSGFLSDALEWSMLVDAGVMHARCVDDANFEAKQLRSRNLFGSWLCRVV